MKQSRERGPKDRESKHSRHFFTLRNKIALPGDFLRLFIEVISDIEKSLNLGDFLRLFSRLNITSKKTDFPLENLDVRIASDFKSNLLAIWHRSDSESPKFWLRFLSTGLEAIPVAISLAPRDFRSRDFIVVSNHCDLWVGTAATDPEDPIHKIFRKIEGPQNIWRMILDICPQKTLKPQNILRILNFYPQFFWGA